jgi:hypothetical protein
MKLLAVGDGKYVNPERITYIRVKSRDKVIIQFQNEVYPGGIGVPSSYLEVKGPDAERLLTWLQANSDRI